MLLAPDRSANLYAQKSVCQFMRAETRKVGRPKVDSEEVRARMPREQLDRIDAWAAAQPDTPGRPEALRRLVDKALEGEGRKPGSGSE